ncbi:MAG TPA: aminomethyl-transferring glycine dehydrogenase subunit GcvPA [Caldithrix abyssi]|uniref:Probable glycine dehydrogenase (decarboxylating) subunit 1 n=1 Tax=Caldithrix abyssi TaxID=187145 RepID=A0A7V4U2V0_CALAY|nr:aminomethyl-transferring glycine dehydrogenase subunit GcvPA [Caldithrix abyssi]
MAYLSNSDKDFAEMLHTIGVDRFEDLIENIPREIRFSGAFNLPEAESELGVSNVVGELADENRTFVSFLGGGAYDHYVPAVVNALISRPEFYTSYTPYQPEVSQGNLQAMYEFQSMVCELTGMDVTNASMYEGGSALAEAVLLGAQQTRKNKILFASTINRRYREVVETYTANMGFQLITMPRAGFTVNTGELESLYDDQTGVFVVQHPNYFGFLEDMEAISAFCRDKNLILIEVYDPISLGILKTPGDYAAHIAIAEGQSLGNAQNFGGPYVGLFSATEKLVRKMPGRLSGMTVDSEGRRGFVLTLQTREQHIRREKATSNICTNSGLMALAAGIYLALLGKQGLQKVADLCLQKAHYLADRLCAIEGVSLASNAPYFKEFTLKLPVPAKSVIDYAMKKGLLPGIDLSGEGYPDHLLVAVTEKRTRQELDALAETVGEAVRLVR